MGRLAETLVWERSRAGKSDLLMLVKIADGADDEGRNAWMEVPHLMKYCRASERATQYTLHRLVEAGEIEIEYNDEGRDIPLKGNRRFRPKWFIHVRCICAWDAYQNEGEEPATSAGSETPFRAGRSKRKPATSAGSKTRTTRNFCTRNPQKHVEKPATSGSAYKEGSLNDLLVEQVQGAAPPPRPERAGAARRDTAPKTETENPDDNLRVITKIAHEVLDLHAQTADVSEGEIVEAVKRHCATLDIAYRSDVVSRAIDSALYQRRRAGKPSLIRGSSGESAFRLQSEAR
jgi:hypothetical protein